MHASQFTFVSYDHQPIVILCYICRLIAEQPRNGRVCSFCQISKQMSTSTRGLIQLKDSPEEQTERRYTSRTHADTHAMELKERKKKKRNNAGIDYVIADIMTVWLR